MGTVKYSGPVASFHCPTEATIRSLKVHFSPKQLGEGTPSPENVREIVGWDGVEIYHHGDAYYVPSGYQRVKYIRIGPYSYLDSGYVPTVAPKIITKIHILSSSDADLFGFANNVVPSFIVDSNNYGSIWYERWGATSYTMLGKQIVGPAICEFGQNRIIGGTLLKTFPDTDWSTNTQSIRIGGARNLHSDMNLYYCDIYDGANLVQRLVPCRRINDGVLGLYDNVNNNFYINIGNGELECGPDVGETIDYEFGVLGKNKFNAYDWQTDESCIEIHDSGSLTVSTIAYIENHNSYDISSTKGITRTLSFKTKTNSLTNENATVNLAVLSDNGTTVLTGRALNLVEKDYETEYIITIPPEGNTLKFRNWGWNGSLTLSDIQLELGSTATTYEPYDPNKTVYGGWVDLISGEVCEKYTKIDLGEIDWTYYAYGNYGGGYSNTYSRIVKSYKGDEIPNAYCPSLKTKSDNAFNLQNSGYDITINIYKTIKVTYNSVTDATTLKSALSGIILICELATPITYHLPPTSMQTFLSHNNIWSNADYVEVEYDLHETQDILARKQFIIANQPHIVKPAAAPLQNFVTDMAAPLKECKVYFEPKQDLNGYSKPWIGGAGKNLFNINTVEQDPSDTTIQNTTARIFTPNTYCIGMSYSNWFQPSVVSDYSINNNSISLINTGNAHYGLGFPIQVKPQTYYSISADITENCEFGVAYYNAEGNHINGSIFTENFTVLTPENVDIMVVIFTPNTRDVTVTFTNIQVEEGQSVTSYEPYENICSIDGWNGIEIYRTGKNLLDAGTSAEILEKWPRSGVTYARYLYGLPTDQQFTLQCNVLKDLGANDSAMRLYLVGRSYNGHFLSTAHPSGVHADTNYPDDSGQLTVWHNYRGLTIEPVAEFNNIQLELGSTATEYEEYNGNTIPITFPSVINMLSSTTITANKTLSSTGEETSESGMSITNYIKVNEGDTYKLTFTSKEGARTRRIYGYDANKDPVDSLASTSWVSVDTVGSIQATIPSGVEYIRVCYKTADENIFLEGPESSVIYGGYLDLTKGEMVQTYKRYNLGELEAVTYGASSYDGTTGTNVMYYIQNTGTGIGYASNLTGYSDKLKNAGKSISGYWIGTWTDPDTHIWEYCFNANNQLHVVFDNEAVGVTADMTFAQKRKTITTWLQDNPITIIAPLETPIHYSITPTTLKALRGINNIWSNSNGNLEIAYWKH